MEEVGPGLYITYIHRQIVPTCKQTRIRSAHSIFKLPIFNSLVSCGPFTVWSPILKDKDV